MTSRFVPVLCAICAFVTTPPATAQSLTRWYLAEGATTSFFEDEILVANPNGVAVTLTLTFLPENGASFQRQVNVPATSRATIRVADHVANDAVSVIVDATADVIVERSMYWPAGARRGGHHANGVLQPSLTWHFAEGSVNVFSEFVLVANPSPTTAANVTITFLRDDGGAPVIVSRVVAPLKRSTVWVNADVPQLAGASFATIVQSTNDVPVLAERAMYWGAGYEGGHGAAGTDTLSQTFRFAEGYTANGFNTFLLMANPGNTAANVSVTLFPETGAPVMQNVGVAAGRRLTLWINALAANPNGAFSMLVQSDVPIAAERAMYWGQLIDGHSTGGSSVEATAWGFAEGLEDGHGGSERYDTYYLFANASGTDATIEATFYREDGTGFQTSFTVPAQRRYTLAPALFPALTFQKFAAFFRSTNAVPFVAERAVYWGGGYYGGHASFGTPWAGGITAPPAPATVSVASISPGGGTENGGTDVTVNGDNFTAGSRLFLGGVEASNVQVVTEKLLTGVTGPHAQGAVDAFVQTPLGGATLPGAYTYEAAPPPPPPPPPSGIDLTQTIFLHTNVTSWAQTSTITGVSIGNGQICVYHTKAGQWPTSLFGSNDPIAVEGNVWIIANVGGQWYAATYDWLRPGQECKFVTGPELGRDQIRIPPLDASWEPRSGDLVGFMVSTRARDHVRAGMERTNVVTIRWP
jgi:hypothetical protein